MHAYVSEMFKHGIVYSFVSLTLNNINDGKYSWLRMNHTNLMGAQKEDATEVTEEGWCVVTLSPPLSV